MRHTLDRGLRRSSRLRCPGRDRDRDAAAPEPPTRTPGRPSRQRRRRRLGRPLRHPDRAAGPQARRQRHRRRGRHGRGARRHRAVQRRHRRRRLLRALRREDRQGRTIDGRETAPAAMPHDAFIDPATGEPYNFSPELVTSGVSVGVPGTLATWQRALDRWGTSSLGSLPAARRRGWRERGFKVDQTFHDQVDAERGALQGVHLDRASSTARRPGARVGSTFRNPDLADTYGLLARRGDQRLLRGRLGREIVRAVRKPPTTRTPTSRSRRAPGPAATWRATAPSTRRRPSRATAGSTSTAWRRPRSGGTTVGEALNILRPRPGALPPTEALHHYLEASALAFADRGEYVGDPAQVDVPLETLLSDEFAAERACLISPTRRSPSRSRPATSPPTTASATAGRAPADTRRTPRTSRPPTSPSPTGGATSSSTPSPSSRPAAPASSCPAAASCSTTS